MQVRADPQAWGAPAGAVEELGKRHRHAKHFKLPDGKYMAVIGRQLHYDPGNGLLEEVDLTPRPHGSGHMADRNDVRVFLGPSTLTVTERRTARGIRWFLPSAGTVSGRRIRTTDATSGLTWDYYTVKSGVKAQAAVSAPRGPQTYEFRFMVIGGPGALSVDTDGNLISDVFKVPRAHVDGANGVWYECSAWTVGPGNKVSFAFDDTALPAEAYPYTIDPTTTFNVAASGDDGHVYSQESTYSSISVGESVADTETVVAASRSREASSNYIVSVGLVRWDTSSLSGTTIDSAVLRAYVDTVGDADARNFTGEWYAGSNWPIDTGDWTKTAASDAFSEDITNITASQDNDFTLTNPDANINKSGYTGLRLHISGGEPGSASPTWNRVYFASYDHATDTEPRLLVTYTAPTGYHMII